VFDKWVKAEFLQIRNMPVSISTKKQRLAEKKKILRQRALKLTNWQKEQIAKEKSKVVILL
jgi:hypothetical protein